MLCSDRRLLISPVQELKRLVTRNLDGLAELPIARRTFCLAHQDVGGATQLVASLHEQLGEPCFATHLRW